MMKKLLLIAALAAVALGANADGYKLEKVWENNDIGSILPAADCRQGFGMNGKFYINNKADQAVYIFDENGLTNESFPGSANCGINRDEAGNILVSTATFPGSWGATAGIRVINPNTGESVEYIVPQECGLLGRCDFLGLAKGDMFDTGVLYLTGGNSTDEVYTQGVAILAVTGGEVDFDETRLAPIDGTVNTQSSQTINYYVDLNGDEALIHAYRSAQPYKLLADGDMFTPTNMLLPNFGSIEKGHANGVFPLIWDGKELFIYPLKPDYRDGWAIAEDHADAPIVAFEATAAANPNGFQGNWLNAEVDADGVTIYQYVPGLCLRVFRLTKEVEQTTNVYILGEVNDLSWAANSGLLMDYDAENDVYTATITLDGRNENIYNYFSFTTELANDNDEGGWAYIAPFRFGAVSDGDFEFYPIFYQHPLALTYENGQAYRLEAGVYTLTLSLTEMKLLIDQVPSVYKRGDVDANGYVNISDATKLINALLNGVPEDSETFSNANADSDMSAYINISDVTALVNFLLNGSW